MSKGGGRPHFVYYANLPRCWSKLIQIQRVVGRMCDPLTITVSKGKPKGRPRKSLGQHFLTDHRAVARILNAAHIGPNDVVVEIGPGQGVLTRRMVKHAKRLVVVELDGELCAALPGRLGYPPNLTCIEADARVANIGPLVDAEESYKVVANLPFYAANPIVRRLLETEPKPELMVVMVQQEVANSMVARPGKMGLLSVATQFYAEASLVCVVPPLAFKPPPKVTSAVVKLVLRDIPAVDTYDVGGFFQVVKAGFSAPRKQLRNSLSHGLAVQAGVAGKILETAKIDGVRRAETLELVEWGRVYHAWETVTK